MKTENIKIREAVAADAPLVGRVAIFNSLIPVVGAVTSCLCLGEPFYWKYLVAALLAMTGIYIINAKKG